MSYVTRPSSEPAFVNRVTVSALRALVQSGIRPMKDDRGSGVDHAPTGWGVSARAESTRATVSEITTRFDALLTQYDRLIRAIVARTGRRLGLTRDRFLLREDIEQEVRLELWKLVARGHVIDFPATYIYKATLRETLRAIRRMASRGAEPFETSRDAERVVDVGDPFQVLSAKEQIREIVVGLKGLAPERQTAVRAHLAGFQFQEIMLMYGWTYQKARNLISRGMADLRRFLNERQKPDLA